MLSGSQNGLQLAIGQLAMDSGVDLAGIPPARIVDQNVAAELGEKSQVVRYPVIHVYTDRIKNTLTEKFRSFSGKVRTVAEVRVSQDRIEGLEERLRLHVDAVTQVLDWNRGSWGEGAYFTGQYQVDFDPVKKGGLHFIQIAKVSFEVDVSS